MPFDRQEHPFGTSLLSRDTPENRALWGPTGVGYANVAESICTEDGQCPHYHLEEKPFDTPIHILIASYRDKLCARTLHNVFERAQNPNRVFVRVVDQTLPDSDLPDDVGCWEGYCKDYNPDCAKYKSQVYIAQQDSRTSKGPTDARSKLSAMVYHDYIHKDAEFRQVQLQDYCMQTDSHMDFSDNYDTELIRMHHRTRNDYAVLSTYVTSMEQNNQDPPNVPNLCMVTFTTTIRNWGTKECVHLVKPKLTNAMWGAGLSFHYCHAELVVPVDPYLDQVFDGEEGSRGIRFFTHGYDVYTPDKVLVTHDYHGHQGNPVVHTWGRKNLKEKAAVPPNYIWWNAIQEARPNVRTVGTKRVNMMLGIGKGHYSAEDLQEVEDMRASRFGLGTKRTLEQAINFTGIDLPQRKMVENKCGNLIWVPFETSPDYGVPEMLARGLTDGKRSVAVIDDETTARRANSTRAWMIAGAVFLFLMVIVRYYRQRHVKRDKHKN